MSEGTVVYFPKKKESEPEAVTVTISVTMSAFHYSELVRLSGRFGTTVDGLMGLMLRNQLGKEPGT